MQTGKCIFFSAEKGYGFLSRDNSPDLFVHHSNLVMDGYRKLDKGDVVEFDEDIGPNNKPQAVNVVVRQKAVA
jgi:CspA family cold shock protein